MKPKIHSAKLCRWAVWSVMAAAVVLCFFMPRLTAWYGSFRHLNPSALLAILAAYYISAALSLAALWQMDRLLENILAGTLFVMENVRRIRSVRLCCLMVSIVCVLTALYYPPLILVSLTMLFLCLVVSVVGSLMYSAVELQEENDLTI